MQKLDDDTIQTLIAAATDVMKNAHVPYSNFRVGAAMLMENGDVITGCNIENASFGGTICAERSAIAAAVSSGRRDIRAICVTNTTDTRITPCGICRQVIYEFGQEIPVICTNNQGDYDIFTIDALLPNAFVL
ncbi:cytidine deaminase [Amylibacter ulvae]|uniref:Cytidine deaminase n=2 Tax=Paramylibacter ulvae TaxID=1651968 RepID=A0ABQ3CVI9_9RHOB|nr:cytidine deaminase [Amylibacter ulvae]